MQGEYRSGCLILETGFQGCTSFSPRSFYSQEAGQLRKEAACCCSQRQRQHARKGDSQVLAFPLFHLFSTTVPGLCSQASASRTVLAPCRWMR